MLMRGTESPGAILNRLQAGPEGRGQEARVTFNPLTNVDPSGFSFFKSLMKGLGILSNFMNFVPGLQGWASVLTRGFITGFLSSGGDLKAGFLGGLTAGAMFGIGNKFAPALASAKGAMSDIIMIGKALAEAWWAVWPLFWQAESSEVGLREGSRGLWRGLM